MLVIATSPIEPGQSVWVDVKVASGAGGAREFRRAASWQYNADGRSYWRADIGEFARRDRVTCSVTGCDTAGVAAAVSTSFAVAPKLFVSLMWRHHQPLYRDLGASEARGSLALPWVRLHALSDYYSLPAMLAPYAEMRATVSLSPVLLRQIAEYLEPGATDRALELTLKPAARLREQEILELLATFFDADYASRISVHPRYRELYEKRARREAFSLQDLRDLQVWFSLAWFAPEFCEREVPLVTGEVATVRRFIEQGRDFTQTDVEELVREQYKVLRAVIPIYRELSERGQIELATTPYYHPNLRALHTRVGHALDHSRALGFSSAVDDVDSQVAAALELEQQIFGRRPRGMWPPEAALTAELLPTLARHGVRWVVGACEQLAESGRWGYAVDDPHVLCRPYRVDEGGQSLSLFFSSTELARDLVYGTERFGEEQALSAWLEHVRQRWAYCLSGDDDHVLSLAIDGDCLDGAARKRLRGLFGALSADRELCPVTFGDYVDGEPGRDVAPHPLEHQTRIYDLCGEPRASSTAAPTSACRAVESGREQRAWELLCSTRAVVLSANVNAAVRRRALAAVHAAESSDWFWHYAHDEAGPFDELFRAHLKQAYRELGQHPPRELLQVVVAERDVDPARA